MQKQVEFLFAHWAVADLKELRGSRWRELVTRVAALPPTHPDSLAFALMMVHLNGCVSCIAPRFRDRGGCANCSRLVLTTLSKEPETALLARYRNAQQEINQALKLQSFEKKVA